MQNVTMYSTSWCTYCVRAKELLARKGARVDEIDVETLEGGREAMAEKSGGRMTVPQIFIGDFHVGGSDDLFALETAGKLDSLLSG